MPRERIRVVWVQVCGRPRAVYRKFGICRICFRDMASNGLIPGVKKASRWGHMMTDSLADMLTRIRNANRIERPASICPPPSQRRGPGAQGRRLHPRLPSRQHRQGRERRQAIRGDDRSDPAKLTLRVFLKYGPEGERVIRAHRTCQPSGSAAVSPQHAVEPVLDGLGISILSTSRGVMSDRRARARSAANCFVPCGNTHWPLAA